MKASISTICALLLMALPSASQTMSEIEVWAPQMPALQVLELAKQIPQSEIRMIDASKLSLAELMEMARLEREDPTRLQCCDWGGGCLPHDHNF